MQFLLRYNSMRHRSESHSRIEDWLQNLPDSGIREMCSWARFCTFAREPERRKVGGDARISIDGISYQVEPDLAGEDVILWWGIFDNELYVELGDKRYGPFNPVGGPIPLHRYRAFKKTRSDQRADRIEALAEKLALPKVALADMSVQMHFHAAEAKKAKEPFCDPDPFQELTFPNAIAAKKAIAEYLCMPLAKLSPDRLREIDVILAETMSKMQVLEMVKDRFKSLRRP
jgi:hypothetical protein